MKAIRYFTPLCISLLALPASSCKIADSLNPATTNVPLTAARKLEGTWSTNSPVTFYYQTDFCTNQRETVASSNWNVTWILTAVQGFENVLDVEMRFSRSASAPVQSTCGNGANGWVPLVSPTFFRATVSSTAIGASDTRQGIKVGGSYITGAMMATWVHYECLIYCFGEFTQTEKLQLFLKK